MPALWSAHQRGDRRRVRYELVPELPALRIKDPAREGPAAESGGLVIAEKDTRRPRSAGSGFAGIELPGNAKILAATYFPERLPSQYLRRWRA